MHPEAAGTKPSSQPRRRPYRKVPRDVRTDAVAQARASSTSATARARGIPRSTLRGWLKQKAVRHDAPGTSAFLQSPEGVRFLHGIVLAAVFVFGVIGGAGAGNIRLFLVLAGLSHWIACSESTLRRTQTRVVDAIGAWGDGTLERLGATMPHRELTLLLDETWKRLMILVAMDAPSGFILAEKHAESRDGKSWNEVMKATFKRLNVSVLQAVADEARGISNYVAMLIRAHRASDLFHGLHELGGVVLALHRKRAAAEAAVEDAVGEARKKARELVRGLKARLVVVTTCIREVSDVFHPFDLSTGRVVSVEGMRGRLEQAIARVAHAAIESGVSARTIERIEKAQRLIPAWCATLAWWQGLVTRTLGAQGLSEPLLVVMREIVLPLRYLESVRARASHASERHRLDDALGTLRERLAAATVWSSQSAGTRQRLESTAAWLAGHFVRASSAVEGHNGFLSLRYHHRRALPPARLKALMVIHNYVIQREDGTTAAERFFGRRHDDLFEHLLEKIPPLPRPRRSRARPSAPPLNRSQGVAKLDAWPEPLHKPVVSGLRVTRSGTTPSAPRRGSTRGRGRGPRAAPRRAGPPARAARRGASRTRTPPPADAPAPRP